MTEVEEQAAESGDTDPDDDTLIAEVAAYDEALAEAVSERLSRIEALEAELDATEEELETATERLERTRADFKNYKERAKRQREEMKERATEDLVERLLDVRDNLTRALEEESGDVESLREGVKLTRKQFDRVLDAENVERIEPDPGEAVDANRHEVMMRVESDQPSDTVADLYRPGYEMAEKVLRPAQVTVSEGDDTESGETSMDADTDEREGSAPTDEGADSVEMDTDGEGQTETAESEDE